MQSPISINPNSIIPKNYTAFKFNNYNKEYKALITNTEYSINIKLLTDTIVPSVSGGGLFKEYILTEIHFHWSSEHIINQRYALEVQLVHYAKKFENLANALNYKDGIVVMTTWYDLSVNSNEVFEKLIETIPDVKMKIEQPIELFLPIIPRNFLPSKIEKFYRYQGSLTTPHFDEVVSWIIFSRPSYLSASQLQRLTKIWIELNKPLKENYRDLQSLHRRRVYLSKI